jgi:hypothetical protein
MAKLPLLQKGSMTESHPVDKVLPECAQKVVSEASPLRHACAALKALEDLGGGGLHSVLTSRTPWKVRVARLDERQRVLNSTTFHQLDRRQRCDLGGLVGHAILLVLSAIMGPNPNPLGALANSQALFEAGCVWLRKSVPLSTSRTDESSLLMSRLVGVSHDIISAQPKGAVATKVVKAVLAGVGPRALTALCEAMVADDEGEGEADNSGDSSGSGSGSELDSDSDIGVQGGDSGASEGGSDSGDSEGDRSGIDDSLGDGAHEVASAPLGLSRRQRTNAYRHLSLLLAGQVVVAGRARPHRERACTSDEGVARMVGFALSAGNTSTLSWGYRTVKTGSGTTIIPRIVRKAAYRPLHQQFLATLPPGDAAARPSFTSFYRVVATLAPALVSVRLFACACMLPIPRKSHVSQAWSRAPCSWLGWAVTGSRMLRSQALHVLLRQLQLRACLRPPVLGGGRAEWLSASAGPV